MPRTLRRVIGGQKHRQTRNFLGLAPAAQRDLGHQGRFHLRMGFHVGVDGGGNSARSDVVHRDREPDRTWLFGHHLCRWAGLRMNEYNCGSARAAWESFF